MRRVLVMGVSGAGKSTVGRALAARLGIPFVDGDDLHPPANLARMRAGVPLDDAARTPWLAAVADWLTAHEDGGVVACSALRRAYRDRLRAAAPELVCVHLDGAPALLRARQADRPGHLMPAVLMDSQLAALEPLAPEEAGLVLDVAAPLAVLLERAAARVRA